MQVHTLQSPSEDEFRRALELRRPAFVYLQGDQLEDGAVSLAWTNCATADSIAGLFGHTLPVTVCNPDLYLHSCPHGSIRVVFLSLVFFCLAKNLDCCTIYTSIAKAMD